MIFCCSYLNELRQAGNAIRYHPQRSVVLNRIRNVLFEEMNEQALGKAEDEKRGSWIKMSSRYEVSLVWYLEPIMHSLNTSC